MPDSRGIDVLSLFAAGSLRGVLPKIADDFKQSSDAIVTLRLGPSGMLRERIESGARPDLFMSADMGHPRRLAEMKLAGPPVVFAVNELCLIARRNLGITSENLLERLLNEGIRLGTSTPVADPGGDYAQQVFRRADSILPGSSKALMRKAIHAVGGTARLAPDGHRSPVLEIFEADMVNAFLGYRTTAVQVLAHIPSLTLVELPEPLKVFAHYGMTILNGAHPLAYAFSAFVRSPSVRKLFEAHGFRTLEERRSTKGSTD